VHTKPLLPDYQDIVAITEHLSLSIHASELHGAISGFLCVGANDDAAAYIQELIEDKDVATYEADIRALVGLLTAVHKQLATINFDFQLLLPDDEVDLAQRAKAISYWCHGFSDSFLESGTDIDKFKTDEAKDAFYHITEVSQLDYDSLSISEADEKAFMELYEYIRMAVLMMYTELQDKERGNQDQGETIH
jgi:uncharacterized protein YgfB (UPF0149 family)